MDGVNKQVKRRNSTTTTTYERFGPWSLGLNTNAVLIWRITLTQFTNSLEARISKSLNGGGNLIEINKSRSGGVMGCWGVERGGGAEENTRPA